MAKASSSLGWFVGGWVGKNLIGIGWVGLGGLVVEFVVLIFGVWRWTSSYLAWIEISEVWAEKSLWMCCWGGGLGMPLGWRLGFGWLASFFWVTLAFRSASRELVFGIGGAGFCTRFWGRH